MASLKVNEIYASIQGEGPNTGVATTFVRFGGCNLRCPGWGRGQLPNNEWVAGCDTVHAVDPAWRAEWKPMTMKEIVSECEETYMVTFTGGEPFVQPKLPLAQLGMELTEVGHTLEIFTNGTKEIPKWVTDLQDHTYIIMDFKLPGSGEYGKFYNLNLSVLRKHDIIKFVCKNQEDIDKAIQHMAIFQNFTEAQFSMGVVWDQLELTEAQLAELLSTDLSEVSLNIQTHKHIWPPDERRR